MTEKKNNMQANQSLNNLYNQFWSWFTQHEKELFESIKNNQDLEKNFFEQMAPQLGILKDNVFFLVGMHNDNTAEIIFTADGVLKNIVLVEDLVAAAPSLANWKFTALKPEHDIEEINIELAGFNFEEKNIHFYPIIHEKYPDEIDLVIVYNNYTEENKNLAYSGTFIFLDHYLGEVNSTTLIDNVNIAGEAPSEEDLIPISKLKGYLLWREKEFVEKYNDINYNSSNDGYTSFEAQLKNGNMLLATINTSVLKWDYKGAFPWILKLSLPYNGEERNGFPNDDTLTLMNNIEDEITAVIPEAKGYIAIGRETGDGIRELYFACREYREVSKNIFAIILEHEKEINISYQIFKDKYWQSFERYTTY